MRAKTNIWTKIWIWSFVILSVPTIWGSLVKLETHHDPIFGDLNKDDANWAAGSIVIGIIFLVIGLIGLDRLYVRDSTKRDR